MKTVMQTSGLTEKERMNYQKCLEAIHSIFEYQNRHIGLMDGYQKFIEQKIEEGKKYTIADIEYLQEILLELDYIQFRQLNISFDMADNFAFIEKNVKENPAVNELSNVEIQRYAEEFAGSKKA